MKVRLLFLLVAFSSCHNTIYVVRHAEKATGIDMATMKPATDPPLSPEGEERALKLKDILGSKNVKQIFSTNTLRTISTARPLKELYLGMPIQLYSSKPDSLPSFLKKIRSILKGDVLIVGHSNTVDDIVNGICGDTKIPGDLKDTEYDNLFVLKRKGTGYIFKREKFGKKSPD
ncbi:MAG TPA: phosphoglycerate mutase family protein [Chitinophagaceae bacterium]|nr:phosphoglycerate mutase family protein [Chitinophagaceae bacterium]